LIKILLFVEAFRMLSLSLLCLLLLILFMLFLFYCCFYVSPTFQDVQTGCNIKCLFGLYRLTENVGHSRNVYKWIRKWRY